MTLGANTDGVARGPMTRVDDIQEIVASAVLAERERCAKLADRYTAAKTVRQARELTTHEVYEIKIFARLIAADIRKGEAVG